jgi:murein DD-endopeptidase / murein LD-carboxypeptidase
VHTFKKNITKILLAAIIVISLLSSCKVFKRIFQKKEVGVEVGIEVVPSATDTIDVVNTIRANETQAQYAKRLAKPMKQIKNIRLYAFINKWLGIRYLWGGTDERGIDCSAFVKRLYTEVYDINIPRTSLEQYYTNWIDKYRNTSYLQEGDLVFFKTMRNNNPVTHVGFYLHDDYFVNASSSKGVSIAKLTDPYWKVKYVACGRLKTKLIIKN